MKDGALGGCHQDKFSESRPLERRKMPFWNKRLKLLSSLISVLRSKTDPLIWKQNANKLH